MPLIPSNNPNALVGYYMGVFSLLPLVGITLAIPALICGFIGIVKSQSNPEVGGLGHGVTAVVLGAISMLVWGTALALMFLR